MSTNNNTAGLSDFERTFGRNGGGTEKSTSPATNPKDRPKAQVWINIGYEVDSRDKDGNPITEFVALPAGIPLDTMEKLPANQRDTYYQQKQQASNRLVDQLMAKAEQLKPGEEIVIGQRGTLQIQMRRVKGEAEIVNEQDNGLIVNLVL